MSQTGDMDIRHYGWGEIARRFGPLVRPHRLRCLWAAVLVGAVGLAVALQPLFAKYVIDEAIPRRSLTLALAAAAVFLLVMFVRITRALAADAPGKYVVASPGIFGPTDAMSMIRGMADFLMEVALPEYEAAIRHAYNECLAGFKHIVEAVYREAGEGGGWFGNHPGLWAPGRINNWSADWIYNIGPRQFEQWVLPEMQSLSRLLEYSFCHLDGFNAVVHLPRMLEIPELTGMQFTRGAGHTLAEALPVFKQIQQGGKVQWIDCAPDEVELLLRELNPRGLLIFTSTPDIESGKALLKKAETWSCRRHRG